MRRRCQAPGSTMNRPIVGRSARVMQAQSDSTMPDAAPAETCAAGTPMVSAISLETTRCSAAMSTNDRPASAIAADTRGSRRDPPRRVRVAAALITGRTPSSS